MNKTYTEINKFRQKLSRKGRPSFKVKIIQNSSRGNNNSTAKTRNECDRTVLKKNNRELALALNNSKACCHVLTQKISSLNAENMDLRTEIAELRRGVINFVKGGSNGETSTDVYGENGSFHSANLEIEYQKRLVSFLEPVKSYLHKGLDSLMSLSDNLSKAMDLSTGPGRRSKSLCTINFSRSKELLSNRRATSIVNPTSLSANTAPEELQEVDLSPIMSTSEKLKLKKRARRNQQIMDEPMQYIVENEKEQVEAKQATSARKEIDKEESEWQELSPATDKQQHSNIEVISPDKKKDCIEKGPSSEVGTITISETDCNSPKTHNDTEISQNSGTLNGFTKCQNNSIVEEREKIDEYDMEISPVRDQQQLSIIKVFSPDIKKGGIEKSPNSELDTITNTEKNGNGTNTPKVHGISQNGENVHDVTNSQNNSILEEIDKDDCDVLDESCKVDVNSLTTSNAKKRDKRLKSNTEKGKSPTPETQIEGCLIRPKRKAAKTAQANFKEQSLNKKMRRLV